MIFVNRATAREIRVSMERMKIFHQCMVVVAFFAGLSLILQLIHTWPRSMAVLVDRGPDILVDNRESAVKIDAGYSLPDDLHLHKFTEDYVECSNLVITDDKSLEIYRDENKTACSPRVFKKYYERENKFYSDGAWHIPKETVPEVATFHPRDCQFDESHLKPGKFSQCLEKRRFNKILVFGDSNGHFFYNQLLEYFRNRSKTCHQVRKQEDGGFRDPEPYFAIPGVPMFQKIRGCAACYSQLHKCWSLDDGRSHTDNPLSIEYIGISAMLHRNMRIYPKNESLLEKKLLKEDTVQEFLLQKYFPHHGVPDLVFHLSPFHHEAEETSLIELHSHVTDLVRLFEKYLPQTSSVVFLNNIRTCPLRSGWRKVQRYLSRWHTTKNRMMHTMNQILFDVLKPKITDADSNMHGFLDFGELSCPVACVWHLDGAHMVGGWYTKMIEYLFEYLCAE